RSRPDEPPGWRSLRSRPTSRGRPAELDGKPASPGDPTRRRTSGFVGLLLRDQAADTLGKERPVERLLADVVESQREDLISRLIAGQRQQDGPLMVRALAKILRDLTGFDPPQGHVDDDAVGVEALGADARLEARGGRLDPEIVGLAEMLAQDRLAPSPT